LAVGGLVDEVDANALFGSTFLLLGELPQGLAVLVRERRLDDAARVQPAREHDVELGGVQRHLRAE